MPRSRQACGHVLRAPQRPSANIHVEKTATFDPAPDSRPSFPQMPSGPCFTAKGFPFEALQFSFFRDGLKPQP